MQHTTEQNQITLSLAAVSANFEHWRATRNKKGKIPDPLWQQVLALLPKYSTSEISRALGISGEQIKNKTATSVTPVTLTSNPASDFVAINIPIPEVVNTAQGSKIEIKRPDGATICIDNLTHQILNTVLAQFIRGL